MSGTLFPAPFLDRVSFIASFLLTPCGVFFACGFGFFFFFLTTPCVRPSSLHCHSLFVKTLGCLCLFAEHLPVKSKLLIFVWLLTLA